MDLFWETLGRLMRVADLRRRRRSMLVGAIGMFALAVFGCGPRKPMTPTERGRIVYAGNCVVCHNVNPNLPGSKGPPIAGSSRELIYDRVTLLKYPPGYTPKRNTHAMRALPQLANRIDDLTAFLADAAKNH